MGTQWGPSPPQQPFPTFGPCLLCPNCWAPVIITVMYGVLLNILSRCLSSCFNIYFDVNTFTGHWLLLYTGCSRKKIAQSLKRHNFTTVSHRVTRSITCSEFNWKCERENNLSIAFKFYLFSKKHQYRRHFQSIVIAEIKFATNKCYSVSILKMSDQQ